MLVLPEPVMPWSNFVFGLALIREATAFSWAELRVIEVDGVMAVAAG